MNNFTIKLNLGFQKRLGKDVYVYWEEQQEAAHEVSRYGWKYVTEGYWMTHFQTNQ